MPFTCFSTAWRFPSASDKLYPPPSLPRPLLFVFKSKREDSTGGGLCLTIREGWRCTPAVFLSLGRSLVLNFMLTCAITMTHTRDHEGLYASVVSRWKPNRIFSFGYGRVEILCGYTNAVLLTITCTNTNQKPKRYPTSISL